MPKQKTHKGTKRRFDITGTGKVTHRKGSISHLRKRKSKRALRAMDKKIIASPGTQKRVHKLLPYGLS